MKKYPLIFDNQAKIKWEYDNLTKIKMRKIQSSINNKSNAEL
jgi:hypothetical protein